PSSLFLLAPPPSAIPTLSLHDALPISASTTQSSPRLMPMPELAPSRQRSPMRICSLPPPDRVFMIEAPPPTSLPCPTTTPAEIRDRKSTRLNSSHVKISYAVFCLKKKT